MRMAAMVVLVLCGIYAAGWFVFSMLFGRSAIHEILSAVYLLIVVVCVAGLGTLSRKT